MCVNLCNMIYLFWRAPIHYVHYTHAAYSRLIELSFGCNSRRAKIKGIMQIIHTKCSKQFSIFFMRPGSMNLCESTFTNDWTPYTAPERKPSYTDYQCDILEAILCHSNLLNCLQADHMSGKGELVSRACLTASSKEWIFLLTGKTLLTFLFWLVNFGQLYKPITAGWLLAQLPAINCDA